MSATTTMNPLTGVSDKVLLADLFCGAGGSSTGATRALRAMGLEPLLTCVNHWPIAIESHTLNHPEARHYIMDLADAVPTELVPEGFLHLLMASPTCTHHSRARGGKPTSDQQRSDPWHVIQWCTDLQVQRLMIENVPEMVSWGPVDARTGKPIPSRKGEYFNAWIEALKEIGFTNVEWRILTAADYGDATTRERFFLLARSDGKPIVWPEPTHSKDGAADLFGNGKKKWRAAREIIDWNDPGNSTFDRPRPLALNTHRRIATGLVKFGGDDAIPHLYVMKAEGHLPKDFKIPSPKDPSRFESIVLQTKDGEMVDLFRSKKSKSKGGATAPASAKPIILQTNKGDQADTAARSVDDPTFTILTRGTMALAEPITAPVPMIFQVNQGNDRHGTQRTVDEPMYTVVTRESHALATPQLDAFVCANRMHNTAKGLDEPVPCVTTAHGGGLFVAKPEITPYTIGQQSNAAPRSVDDPIATVATAGKISLIEPAIEPFVIGQQGGATPRSVDEPIPTVSTAGFIRLFQATAKPFLLNRHGENGTGDRSHSLDQPMPTVTCRGAGYLIEPTAEPYLVNMKGQSNASDIDEPTPTITAHAPHLYVAQPYLVNMKKGSAPLDMDTPLPTLTAHSSHVALAEPYLVVVNHGDDRSGNCDRRAKSIDAPVPTITTNPSFAVAKPELVALAGRTSAGIIRSCPAYLYLRDTTDPTRFVAVPANTEAVAAGEPGAFLTPFYGSNVGTNAGADSVDEPLATVTAKGNKHGFCSPFLTPFYGSYVGTNAAADGVDEPLASVTTKARFGLCEPFLAAHFGEREGQAPRVHSIDDPVPTVTSRGGGELVQTQSMPLIVQVDQTGSNGACVRSVEQPLATIVTKQNVAVVEPFIVSTRHVNGGPRPRSASMPLPTITGGGSQSAVVEPRVEPNIETDTGRIVWINGIPHRLDIRFRMLRNPELARAMGFSDEETDYEFAGTQTEITKQIGNAVPVNTATALVSAIMSDLKTARIEDENQLAAA